MPNPGDLIGGRYQILNELGSGGFGTTYLAKDMELPNKPKCVVKQLQPRFNSRALWQNAKERFGTEAMVLRRLGNHDQIPQLIAHFEENEEFYLVQEFIDGEELRKEVCRKPFHETQVIEFLRDVLQVLDFVHQQGVIHRDIKPSNLIRRQSDGKIVLIDFGAVKEIGTLSFNAETQTLMTSVIGTPGYMAPEQQNGRPFFSSDIYALGRTAIYALTGQSPMELEDTETGDLTNWDKHVSVSPKLAAILNKMIRPKYSERYHSVAEVLRDLEPLLKIGQTVGGRYKIVGFLGGGRWSYTYVAENLWRKYQSPCVIKQLKSQGTTDAIIVQEAERRFSTELTVLEKLGDHPQIPKLLDHFEEDEEFYLVQAFIDGKDLGHEILPGKRWSEDKVIALLQDVSEILDFIHKNRVIHRDIKPSNLIRRRSDDKIVLIDFGVVKEIVSATSEKSGFGSSTQPIGTEGYMPPEQMAGRPAFGSDIYALGMTAIQALTGIYPDQFDTNPQTGEIIWQEGVQIDPRLAKILNKMICIDLAARYQSAAEILKDLKKIGRNLRPKLNKTNTNNRISVSTRPPWVRSLIGMILIPGGIGGFLFFLVYVIQVTQTAFLFRQADLKLRSQDYLSAINYYEDGLQNPPPLSGALLNFEKAWIQKAFALSALKRYNDMLQSCEAAIALNKESVYGWICKGSALDGLERYQDSIQAYGKAISIDPSSFEAWHNRGHSYLKLGKKDDAIANFNQAVAVGQGKNFVTWNDMGKMYFQYKEYEKARESYQESIKVKPDYLPAWIGLGNVQTVLKEYEEAIKSFNEALEINDEAFEAWYGKGRAEEGLRRYEEAVRSYERAIFIKPNYQPAIDARQRVIGQMR
ncbi:MAG: protein kinase [Hydrococcus sp. C42_A2020_068]|uniref:serine/threonine-protein kinase n=1 Tax=Pleurocapsa sp. PCC 7327 TaxID=118163 RepID=UPI00029F9A4D|nr:serine/threonine-protein kinase [Pleurocapsa sp. PCC 7327]AFY79724.1 tetratricopeptide repeat protein,protein kinase family protein [Pleurocapsa sp. PCC 7327]MBF2021296.1 protein kinase [Hydrococcus sp. C42_A2020_068]